MTYRALAFATGLAALALSVPGQAKEIEVTLNSIKNVVANERGDDELYINVTAFHSDGKFTTYTVPGGDKPTLGHYGSRFPAGPPRIPQAYWPAKALSKVKDIPLWKGDVTKDSAVQLVVALVEHDIPPWNLDDMIGSVKIKIGMEKGQLSANWTVLSAEAIKESGQLKMNKSQQVELRNGEGHYQIKLTVKS